MYSKDYVLGVVAACIGNSIGRKKDLVDSLYRETKTYFDENYGSRNAEIKHNHWSMFCRSISFGVFGIDPAFAMPNRNVMRLLQTLWDALREDRQLNSVIETISLERS